MKLFSLSLTIQHKQWGAQSTTPTSEDLIQILFLVPSWFSGIETTEVAAMSERF